MGNEFKSIASQDGTCSVNVGEYAGDYRINFKVGGENRGTIDANGLFEIDNISCRGTIQTANFETDTISVVGGSILVRPGDALSDDMTALDASTLTITGNETFAVDDILRIKDGLDDEWFTVTDISGAPTYTVTRDRADLYVADNNPAWTKGVAVVNYGPTGDGGILLTSSLAHSPYMSVFTHTGTPWTSVDERVRVGNLNGYLGYGSDIHGVGIGSVGSGEANLTFDPINGIRFRQGTTNLFTIDMSNYAILQQIVLQDLQSGSDLHGQYITNATILGSAIANATITGGNIANATIAGGNIDTATITSDNITNGTIVGADLASATITSDNITNGTIVGADLASATISGSNIANATIAGGNIDTATITSDNITNGTIVGADIASATISGSNIANATIVGGNIDGATITGPNLAAGTIIGSNIANATIVGSNIAPATVTGGNIANTTITTLNIANATITGGNIDSSTIATGNMINQAITAGKIENLTITASQIANLTITGGATGKIATSTISETNIVANTITALSIATNAITTDELAANAVTANNILANTVSASKMDATDIFVGMTLQSTIYTPGTTGWKIDANGNVDFTSGTATWSLITGAGKPDNYADVTSTHTAANITGQGTLATENNLDGVPNGTTYGRVLTTAISAGKIRLSSLGVTGTLSTTFTVADKTSANGQNLGWLIGSTGTLTISSGGTLYLNTADALIIQAAGNMKMMAGSDIAMYSASGNHSKIKLYGTTGVHIGDIFASESTLCGWYTQETGKTLQLGATNYKWDHVNILANTVSSFAYYNGNNFAGTWATSGSGNSCVYLCSERSGITRSITFDGIDFKPSVGNSVDLGTSGLYWDNAYADNVYYKNLATFDLFDDIQVIKDIKTIKDKNGVDVLNKFGAMLTDPESIPDIFTNKRELAADLSKQSGIEITDTDLDAIRAGEKTIKWKETYMENVYNKEKKEDELIEKEKEIILDAQGIKDRTFFNAKHMSQLSIGAIKQLEARVAQLEAKLIK